MSSQQQRQSAIQKWREMKTKKTDDNEYGLIQQIKDQYEGQNYSRLVDFLEDTDDVLRRCVVKESSTVSNWVKTDINNELIKTIKTKLQYANIVEKNQVRLGWDDFKKLFIDAIVKLMTAIKTKLENMIAEYQSVDMQRIEADDLKTITEKLNIFKTFKGFGYSPRAKELLENVIEIAEQTYNKQSRDDMRRRIQRQRDREIDARQANQSMQYAQDARSSSGTKEVAYKDKRSVIEIPSQPGIKKRSRRLHNRVVNRVVDSSSESDDQ